MALSTKHHFVVAVKTEQGCSSSLTARTGKGFKKARRAKLGVNTFPELAALLVNWTIGFQKEKEVERNSAESFHLLH